MEKSYRFGPVILSLRDLPISENWPFRDWKLDPYRMDKGQPDILVDFPGQPVVPEGAPVWESRSMYALQQLWQHGDSLLWQHVHGKTSQLILQLEMEKDGSKIHIRQDASQTQGMAVLEALTFLIFYAMLYKKVLTFHGALVELDGQGIILAGESGVGKTTQARLWRDHAKALILNGDRSACYQKDGLWTGFGTPWCGTSGEHINREVPVQALVLLRQSTQNRITRLEGMSLLQAVLPHSVYPHHHPALTDKMLSLLDDFLTRIPVVYLDCTPDVRSMDALRHYLEQLP